MKKILYTALGAALLLASCQNEELPTIQGNYPQDGVVRISTQVNAPTTRANTSNYTGSDLSLSIEGSSDRYSYTNIEWSTADNGASWTPATTMLWQGANHLVNVYAYAPFVEGVSNIAAVPVKVDTDQSSNGIDASDFLGFVNNNFSPYNQLNEKQAVEITFDHILSKLTVTLTLGSQFDGQDLTVSSVKLVGTNTTVSYDAMTKALSDAGTPDAIAMMRVGTTNSYTAILVPQTIAAGKPMIDVTLSNGSTYRYNTTGVTFATGTAYTMNMRIGKDKLEVVQDVTVGDWDSTHDGNDLGGGEAVEPPVILDITALSADEITDDLIASYIGGNGTLVVSGEYTGTKMQKISAYVRAGAGKTPVVAHIDLTAMTGLTYLTLYNYGGESNTYYDLTFLGSNSLTTAKLPTTVTDISNTFNNCSNLTSVTGVDNVTLAMSAFYNCTSLTKVPHMPLLEVIQGTFARTAITEFVHDKITAIKGSSSFSNCSALTMIDCPNATILQNDLFTDDCSQLTEIHFTAEVFSKVRSFLGSGSVHLDPFTGFANRANAMLYLNASQRDKVEVNGTDCIWTPYELNSTDLEEPVVLTGFKAVYCGDELVYSSTPAAL